MNCFTYAGFQCVTLPTMIACGTPLTTGKACSRSMWLSFGMNAVALVLSIFMLLSWQGFYTSGVKGDSHPHPDGVPGDGHGLADGGVRRVPAAVPDLHP